MLKIVLLVTGVAALLLSFIPSLRTEATPFLQHPDAIYLAILGLINLLFAPVLQSSHPTRPLQAGAAALLVLGVVLQALILLAPLPTIADQPAIVLPLLSLVLATALQLAGSLKPGKPVSRSASAPAALGGSQDSGNRETGTVKWFNTSKVSASFPAIRARTSSSTSERFAAKATASSSKASAWSSRWYNGTRACRRKT